MATSDQLTKLAARAKLLEDRYAAVQGKVKSDVEQDVKRARESAQARADELGKTAAMKRDAISTWWDGVQRSWNNHRAAIRQDVDEKRAAHDLKKARRNTEQADSDAEFAIDFAYAAIEEAEYAVLDATLAHMELDELTEA